MNRRELLALGGTVLFGAVACKREGADRHIPELGTISGFRLTDQHGRPFGDADLRGRVWVASFFFTRCPTVCPRVMRRVRQLQEAAQAAEVGLQLVSFSVDPEHDTPPVMLEYSRRFDAKLDTWTFLTGDLATVKKTCVEGFKLALEGRADAKADHYGILHGSHLVLVDGRLRIRGYYRSSDEDAHERLLGDAKALLDA